MRVFDSEQEVRLRFLRAAVTAALMHGRGLMSCCAVRQTWQTHHVPSPGFCFVSQVGYFHAYQDGVDYVFVDHPCYHAFASAWCLRLTRACL